ncbi:MAG: helix-turn-helix domain-containing protein, partial [Thomasclavelia spiroformis]
MNEELKETLYRIINELPDECSWLDYKEIPYLDKQRAEFIRDLCAFLNSNESFEKDKYIILGVTNDKKTIGLRSVPMQDDSWYQTLADYIFPRPSIRTGTFKYTIKDSEVEFGYILIYGTNVDRIYEINRQAYYGPEKPNSQSELEEYSVYPSTAWIRMGSCKRFLTEYDRRKIYEIDRKNELDITTIIPNYQNVNISSDNEKIIKTVTLFGGWDEENENDKNIISEFIGKPYEQWISILRTMLKDKTNFLEFKNNKWVIQDRFTNLKKYANDYFKDELEKFKKDVIQILSERNPKFDLSSDKRSMANIYNKTLTYSNLLRKSVAETLPIITANYKEFKKCTNTALNLSLLVVRETLKKDNWEIWASLDELLPLLAEASPEEFLHQLEDKIRNNSSLIKHLFNENESYITTINYSTGLY